MEPTQQVLKQNQENRPSLRRQQFYKNRSSLYKPDMETMHKTTEKPPEDLASIGGANLLSLIIKA